MAAIILASQSPRRKQLLEWAEIPFDVVVKTTSEEFPPGLSHEEAAIHIARQKAEAVQDSVQGKIIIAADTIVVLDNDIIGKPENRNDAINILARLSGRQHMVITGVVIRKGTKEIAFAEITEVNFHQLTDSQVAFYVDKYQPYDKAGAYAIQEWIGVVGIQSVRGDFYNVMGLPVSRVVQALNSLNAI
ncbi:MAG: Maf family protein [Flavisolibacter sp.]